MSAYLSHDLQAALPAAVFDHSPDAIFLFDDDLRYVDANPAACDLLGYTRDELRRLAVPDVTPEEDRHLIPAAAAAFRAAGRLRKAWRLRAKDGTVWAADLNCAANVLPGVHLSAARVAADQPKAGAGADPVVVTARPPRRRTVLLVEDEDAVREFVRFVLEQNGYAVVSATDGEHALTLFRADPGRFDLVLSDVLMPHRTGPELAAEIRRLRPGVRVVFMSGYTGTCCHPIDMPPGVALLEKPFSLDRLLGTVTAAIGH